MRNPPERDATAQRAAYRWLLRRLFGGDVVEHEHCPQDSQSMGSVQGTNVVHTGDPIIPPHGRAGEKGPGDSGG
jgi:extradiol dioxygenase family protein